MSEKRFIVVKGCDNNVEKEGYFIQDTHYGVLKFGSFWKEKFAKEDCKRLNDVCELIEELHTSDHMGWGRAEHFEKELKQKKIYIKRLEYKVQKFKEMNSEQQAIIRKLQDLCGKSDYENAKLREEVNLLRPTNIEQYEQIQKLQEENEKLKNRLNDSI